MKLLREIYARIKYWKSADRLGPDMLWTHYRLYIKSLMLKMCQKKFMHFDPTAEIRPGAYIIGCSRISVGKRVVIRPATMIFADSDENGASIYIEDDVLIGSATHIMVSQHTFRVSDIPIIDQGKEPSKEVTLKRGCWIGANCTILPGVTIGENAVIGAGSVVTRDIPPRVLAVGVPAKVIRDI